MEEIRIIMDYSFNRASLARCLTPTDFYKLTDLTNENVRRKFIEDTVIIADNIFRPTPNLLEHNSKGKVVYEIDDLKYKLILRKCVLNIKAKIKNKLKTRSKIIRELKSYLAEGTPYCVYRLDISSFYENCNTAAIVEILEEKCINYQTIQLINGFLSKFNENYTTGLPRGIEISPILSDIYLEKFDSSIKSNDQVFYFARFVDDMIIITSGKENYNTFNKWLVNSLPDNLKFNHNKKSYHSVRKKSDGSNNPVLLLDFLGYQISVNDQSIDLIKNDVKLSDSKRSNQINTKRKQEFRDIHIDIANKKTKKIVEKIHKSFYSFAKQPDFRLLKDRLLFLSTNRELLNKDKDRKIPTGIYYNYSDVNKVDGALTSLDRALNTLILNPNNRLKDSFRQELSISEQKELLKISFINGFEKRVFKTFSPNRLREITRIW